MAEGEHVKRVKKGGGSARDGDSQRSIQVVVAVTVGAFIVCIILHTFILFICLFIFLSVSH